MFVFCVHFYPVYGVFDLNRFVAKEANPITEQIN